MQVSLILDPWVVSDRKTQTHLDVKLESDLDYDNEGEHYWQEFEINTLKERFLALQFLVCDAAIVIAVDANGNQRIVGQIISRTSQIHDTVKVTLQNTETALNAFCGRWPKSWFTLIFSQTCVLT